MTRIMTKLLYLGQMEKVCMKERGHESFKVINLQINDIMMEIKASRKKEKRKKEREVPRLNEQEDFQL